MPELNNSISVVITAYNSEKYIAEAIECVIAQTCPPDEIVVIDDGSEDETQRIVQTFKNRVRYIYQENSGASAARNNGMANARCGIVSFLDADDVWLPDKLMRQKTEFAADSTLDIAFTHVRNFYSKELDTGIKNSIQGTMEAMPGHIPSAFITRKEAFTRVGPFDTTLKMGEFIDWYCRAKEYPIREAMIPEVLVYRRLHIANQGISKRSLAHQDYLKIIRQKLKRSREPDNG